MSKTLRVLYLQLPVPDFGYDYWGADHPLAGGYLAACSLARGVVHEPLFLPSSLTTTGSSRAIAQAILDADPQVVVGTLYLWNVERTLEIARLIKQARPDLRVISGGPESAVDFSRRFADHPFDWVHDGEGEGPYPAVLSLLDRDIRATPEELAEMAAAAPARVVLETIVSPYAGGLLAPAPDGSIWVESMRGCPFGCAYCYYGKSYPEMRWFPENWLRQHLVWAHEREATEVYLLDPSFQISPGLHDRLDRISQWNDPPIPLHTETRVDTMTSALADGFARAGFRSVETGLQSIHAHVLREIRRSGDADAFVQGARMLLDRGIRVQTDVIVGLPGDTPQGFVQTVEFLAQKGLTEDVAVYPLLGLPGTPLRERAGELGIRFRSRPPYQIEANLPFGMDEWRGAVEQAERFLQSGLFPLHLPDFTPREDLHDLIGFVEIERVEARGVGLEETLQKRLSQCPVFLFRCRDRIPWDRIRTWGEWQREANPHLMPFWGVETTAPFSLRKLQETLGALHDPDSYQAGVWSLCPDPYLRLSCRSFVLSSCPGDPGFWLDANEIVPVIRVTPTIPLREGGEDLEKLPVLWTTRRVVGKRILSSLLSGFRDREDGLLFTLRENAQAWADLTGLPLPFRIARTARVRLP